MTEDFTTVLCWIYENKLTIKGRILDYDLMYIVCVCVVCVCICVLPIHTKTCVSSERDRRRRVSLAFHKVILFLSGLQV